MKLHAAARMRLGTVTLRARLADLVRGGDRPQPVVASPGSEFDTEFLVQEDKPAIPFIKVPCQDCGGVLIWDDPVIPGTVAIIRCTCGAQWAAVAPRIYFVHAEELDVSEDQRLD